MTPAEIALALDVLMTGLMEVTDGGPPVYLGARVRADRIDVRLTELGAGVLVSKLSEDVVDRVEVAVVVEHLAELHAPWHADDRGPALCAVCSPPQSPWSVLFPCETRKLLAQLPGGAL